jgi:hypothetical protein
MPVYTAIVWPASFRMPAATRIGLTCPTRGDVANRTFILREYEFALAGCGVREPNKELDQIEARSARYRCCDCVESK